MLQKFGWIIPFLCFIAGYYCLALFFSPAIIDSPCLVGKSVYDALLLASPLNLTIRIMAEREDLDLPTGTIIYQTPHAGKKIKPHQAIHIVVSKKPPLMIAPNFIDHPVAEIEKIITQKQIPASLFYIPSLHPQHHAFAQVPAAGDPIERTKKMTIYSAQAINKPMIMPNLKGKPFHDVQRFLANHPVELVIIKKRDDQPEELQQVINQYPLPHSLVTLQEKKPLLVQVELG